MVWSWGHPICKIKHKVKIFTSILNLDLLAVLRQSSAALLSHDVWTSALVDRGVLVLRPSVWRACPTCPSPSCWPPAWPRTLPCCPWPAPASPGTWRSNSRCPARLRARRAGRQGSSMCWTVWWASAGLGRHGRDQSEVILPLIEPGDEDVADGGVELLHHLVPDRNNDYGLTWLLLSAPSTHPS